MEDQKIYTLFQKLGISPDNKGYHYAFHIVKERFASGAWVENVGDSYAKVMEKFGTSYRSTERNIRFVNTKMFDSVTKENRALVEEVFGTTDYVPNGRFIASICEYLKYN